MGRPRKSEQGPAKVDYAAVKDILIPYQRVSTREQADSGAGLAAQRRALDAGLAIRGATALTWDMVDAGEHGTDMHRPKMIEALELVRAGQAGGIIVAKLDRLSRSLLDFANLMAQAEREGWNLIMLDVGVELNTPVGRALAGMLAVFAQFERDVISQRTKNALAERKAAGVHIGRKRDITDDLLKDVIGRFLKAGNMSAVARHLNADAVPLPRGGKQWHPASVQKIVRSPEGQALMAALAAEEAA